MTIRSFINFGQTLHRVGGIDIHVLENQSLLISYTVLEQRKNVVAPVKHAVGIPSITQLKTELSEWLPEASRIHINLQGKDILTKTSERKRDATDDARTIKSLFPMFKAEEIATQQYQNEKFSFCSIIRKDVFDIVSELNGVYTIVSASLGIFIVSSVAPFLNTEELVLKDCSVLFKDTKIVDVKASLQDGSLPPVSIGGDSLPVDVIVSYASAWNILFQDPELNVSDLSWMDESIRNYKTTKKIYDTGKTALIVTLCTLMLNTALYFWLQSKAEFLVAQNVSTSEERSQNKQHNKELEGLLTIYNAIGWKSNIIPIYYADQLAQSVTSEIQLNFLEIGVLDPEIQKKEKRQVYQPGLIGIKGIVDTPVTLRKWISTLEKLSWVENIVDQKYSYDGKLNTGSFEFYIVLK